MLAKRYRFHGLNSLRFLFNGGKSAHSPNFTLRFKPNSRRRDFRLAVVVSRKVSKSAVVRNRIRRRIYEFMRKNSNKVNQPYDMAIIVKNELVADMNSAELSSELTGILKKAEII